jgi:hypothetical protein
VKCLSTVAGLSQDFHIWLGPKQGDQTLANNRVVIG